MSLRRIKHALLRLSPEEKIIGLGTLFIIIGCFMPWHSIVMSFDNQSITETGFGGDLGVIGFVIFIMAIMALLTLIGDNLHIKLPQFGYSKEQILFFLMGQNAFLVLLTIAVYTKRSLEFTNAELRFGIYLALIGAFLGAFSAFAQVQKLKKKEVTEFFDHEEEPADRVREKLKVKEEVVVEEPEELFDEPEPESIVKEADEYIVEDDIIEEIEEIPQVEPKAKGQGSYFRKEAKSEMSYGEEAKEDSETNKKEDKSEPTISMNFYEDQ
ncbi:hypothetical protein KKA95_02950 [Patescibacteria group bacterium]|nr:hypothetical protein [Patescibacteria group bacterium]